MTAAAKATNREARALLRFAESLGFALVRSKNHFVVRRGRVTVSIPKTPHDRRSIENTRHDLLAAIRLEGGAA